nr:putative salivary protein [Nilaparvata lugens]
MEGYNWSCKTFLLALLLIIPVIIQISEGRDPGGNGRPGRRCTCRFCTNLRQINEDTQRKTDAKFDFDVYNFNNKSQNNDRDSFDGGDLQTIRNCPEFINLWGSQELANQVVVALREKVDTNNRVTRDNFNTVMEQFKNSESNNAKGAKTDKDPESEDKKRYRKGPKK